MQAQVVFGPCLIWALIIVWVMSFVMFGTAKEVFAECSSMPFQILSRVVVPVVTLVCHMSQSSCEAVSWVLKSSLNTVSRYTDDDSRCYCCGWLVCRSVSYCWRNIRSWQVACGRGCRRLPPKCCIATFRLRLLRWRFDIGHCGAVWPSGSGIAHSSEVTVYIEPG